MDGTIRIKRTARKSTAGKAPVKMITEAPYENPIEILTLKLKKKDEELESLKQDHSAELETLKQRHAAELKTLKEDCEKKINLSKAKTWCSNNCGEEGNYYCCLRVSYCSVICQHSHWKAGHVKMCQRGVKGKQAHKGN